MKLTRRKHTEKFLLFVVFFIISFVHCHHEIGGDLQIKIFMILEFSHFFTSLPHALNFKRVQKS